MEMRMTPFLPLHHLLPFLPLDFDLFPVIQIELLDLNLANEGHGLRTITTLL